jgi:DNA polymerase III delta prime subunit
LLEPRTAEQFRDECLDLTLNVRPIIFLFTCNELSEVQPAILSRLRVVEVKAPNAAQMPAVVRSIDRSVRESNPAIARLFHPLSAEVIARLKTVNPRQLSSLLPQVYGLAAVGLRASRTKRRVYPKHVAQALERRQSEKVQVRFGFVPETLPLAES